MRRVLSQRQWAVAHLNRRVGLGMGLGVRPLLLTRICSEGEKHCCWREGEEEHEEVHQNLSNCSLLQIQQESITGK